MKPHRPIDLDAFDEEFFSSAKEEKNEKMNNNKVFSEESPSGAFTDIDKVPAHLSLTQDVIDGLMKVKTSDSSPVFHDLPQEKESNAEEPFAPSKRTPQISEDEALKSFPDFKFDPTLFENAENESALPLQEDEEPLKLTPKEEREEIKLHKEKAKQDIKDEKEKIKAQKKLESTVQKPFRSRRILALLMCFFIIIGFLAAAASTVIYKTGSSPDGMFSFREYSLCYIDGVNVKSSITNDSLVLLKQENISSNRTIMFINEDEYRLESLVAIGDKVCAVGYSNGVATVQKSNIIGAVYFSLDGIGPVYKFIHNRTTDAIIIFAAYEALTIIVFSLLIAAKNRKIKKYREEYQLVR